MDSKGVFHIISEQHGFENLNDLLPSEIESQQEIAGFLLLHQRDDSLIWDYSYINKADVYYIHINATTGQVISSSTRTVGIP